MKKRTYQLLAALLGTSLLLGVAAAFHAVDKFPEEKFAGKISITQMSDAELNCETFECIITQVHEKTQKFLDGDLTWTSDRGDLTVTMSGMGVSIPTAKLTELLDDFMNLGRLEKMTTYFFGRTYNLIPAIDQTQLKEAFADSGIEQGKKNANYYYDGVVKIDPEQIGYGIDQDVLTALISFYWNDNSGLPTSTELPLRISEPKIGNADLEALLEQAQQVSGLTFELQGEWGGTRDLYMNDHMDWLSPGETLTFKVDEEKFKEYVDLDLVEDIEEEAASVIIVENEDGTYDFEGSARFGKKIAREDFLAAFEGYLEGKENAAIPIPIETTKPEVKVPDSLRARGVTDLLEFGYTSFAGSPTNRIHNVNRGMNLFNGTLVKQGEEFSFTSLLGPVDGAHGWREELVIVGDETKPEYGGGLCQVSSTMFRAALYSGLPITARKEHSYAVSYYAYPNGYGLDATVYQPNPDLRFLNDTPGDILIQGYTDGNMAYFVVYGTNDGRSVQMEGPYYHDYVSPPTAETIYTTALDPGVRKLKDHSHTGFQVDWYRTVLYGDGTSSERKNIHTYYEARPEKWEEGSPEGETETEAAGETETEAAGETAEENAEENGT